MAKQGHHGSSFPSPEGGFVLDLRTARTHGLPLFFLSFTSGVLKHLVHENFCSELQTPSTLS